MCTPVCPPWMILANLTLDRLGENPSLLFVLPPRSAVEATKKIMYFDFVIFDISAHVDDH